MGCEACLADIVPGFHDRQLASPVPREDSTRGVADDNQWSGSCHEALKDQRRLVHEVASTSRSPADRLTAVSSNSWAVFGASVRRSSESASVRALKRLDGNRLDDRACEIHCQSAGRSLFWLSETSSETANTPPPPKPSPPCPPPPCPPPCPTPCPLT